MRGGVSFFIIFIHNSHINILQRIFTDYYEEIEYTLNPRKTEIDNINKMINCGAPAFGGAMYGFPHCGKLKIVPFMSCYSSYNKDFKFLCFTIRIREGFFTSPVDKSTNSSFDRFFIGHFLFFPAVKVTCAVLPANLSDTSAF
jgi:hypothetical protein